MEQPRERKVSSACRIQWNVDLQRDSNVVVSARVRCCLSHAGVVVQAWAPDKHRLHLFRRKERSARVMRRRPRARRHHLRRVRVGLHPRLLPTRVLNRVRLHCY